MEKSFNEILEESFKIYGIELSEKQEEQFFSYKSLLKEWNEKMNLTAITDDAEIALRHFADSVSLLKDIELKDGDKVIDVGTGAGFPGVPVKIVRPGIDLCLMDSLNKRITFLENLVSALGMDGVSLVHARAEDAGRSEEYREKFDFCISRAVAPLSILCEYCLPFVKEGGYFISLKGPDVFNEAENAKAAFDALGGKIEEIKKVPVFGDASTRYIVITKKIRQTPPKYPRKSGAIKKKPII